ncbi:uncharacterized protein LOC134272774 isoform X2 [Saccostrea cucullata]|uniref:uncharacterized protein LOC134272774 isoform X2 n=1 Tax=Saccostrea cuccullata TaxID=36930 RepID=UPI002ED5549C
MTAVLNCLCLALCIGFLNAALVPRCFQKCFECKDQTDDYDIGSCQNNCLKGRVDYQCSMFSTATFKRSFEKRALECKKYCYYCKLTYPEYNGSKCVNECQASGGLKMDLNCISYW